MKYIKLFEDLNDFGQELSKREKQVLDSIMGDYYTHFDIRVDDGYYYTYLKEYENEFDGFQQLKDYLSMRHYFRTREFDKLLNIYKSTEIDPSFDDYWLIKAASEVGVNNLFKILYEDKRMEPGLEDCIHLASLNGHEEILKILLKDPRVEFSDVGYTLRKVLKNDKMISNNEIIFKLIVNSDKISNYQHMDTVFNEVCKIGNLELVKLLLSKSSRLDAWWGIGLESACLSGNREVVEYLLKDGRVDPSFNKNSLLKNVYNSLSNKNGKWKMIKLLTSDPRVYKLLTPEEKVRYKVIEN